MLACYMRALWLVFRWDYQCVRYVKSDALMCVITRRIRQNYGYLKLTQMRAIAISLKIRVQILLLDMGSV